MGRVEVLKAMDKYGFISNSSHGILDIRRYPKMLLIMEVISSFIHGYGIQTIIQMQMKRRRRLQNEFRINAWVIKDNFNNSVGLFADDFSKKNGA
jgi:hypothetical protein